MNITENRVIKFILLLGIFYFAAYGSVSPFGPTSIPVHHDDYSNYSTGFDGLSLRIRPLSTFVIAGLSSISPDALIWGVRLMAVTYVMLCLILFESLIDEKNRWLTMACFAVIVFSSPMVAEYARYTGMVTHLISGCLGMLAVIFLRRSFYTGNTSFALMSAGSLFLSILAKEDFLVFYGISYVYFFCIAPKEKRIAGIGLLGMILSAAAVVFYKTFSGTYFLGVTDPNSSYYISILPSSIVKTVGAYLVGAGHPAMMAHGNIVLVLIGMALILSAFVRHRYSSQALYFIACTFGIMAPYTLLPNHVNPYYEHLWYPFIIFAFYAAATGALLSVRVLPLSATVARYFTQTILIFVTCLVAFLDLPGRNSVAGWYGEVAGANKQIIEKLVNVSGKNNGDICIFGASAFSPWYMHGGRYLDRVMGMSNTWTIYLPEGSDKKPGFDIGANSSNGRIKIKSEKTFVPGNCEVLDHGTDLHG